MPVSIYNGYQTTNEIGRRYEREFRNLIKPLLEKAMQEEIDMRHLYATFAGTLDILIGDHLLRKAIEMKQAERDKEAQL